MTRTLKRAEKVVRCEAKKIAKRAMSQMKDVVEMATDTMESLDRSLMRSKFFGMPAKKLVVLGAGAALAFGTVKLARAIF